MTLMSCKEKEKNSFSEKRFNVSKQDFRNDNKGILTLIFPDTVSIKTMIKGEVKYNRNYGEVQDSKIEERYIFFHVGTDKDSQNLALEKFDKFQYRLAFEDTIGNGLIKFETVFTEPGTNYLHGVIKDMYEIENSDKMKDSVKVSNQETTITKRVYVIDDEKLK